MSAGAVAALQSSLHADTYGWLHREAMDSARSTRIKAQTQHMQHKQRVACDAVRSKTEMAEQVVAVRNEANQHLLVRRAAVAEARNERAARQVRGKRRRMQQIQKLNDLSRLAKRGDFDGLPEW